MRVLVFLKFILSFVGIALLLGAALLAKSNYDFIQSSQLTEGTVVSFNTKGNSSGKKSYAPVISYVDSSGQTHKTIGKFHNNTSGYRVGGDVELYYNKTSPNEAKINRIYEMWIDVIMLSIIGVIVLIMGIALFAITKKPNVEKFKREGTSVKAVITEIGLNTLIDINNKSPYKINAQWHDKLNNTVHVFSSENIWFDPSPYVNNDEITVYIMKNNPKKYYMDISFLPKKA